MTAGRFRRGEAIVTEPCYKPSPEVIAAILQRSGWRVLEAFVDDERRVRLWLAMRV
ncbi:MAG: L-histidine N(alpha)-methyltransferase [Archangium sp.]|nr:L-histidine N(alpha)-methyltransferase [Archangium sp.]MDP3158270.1 L-histidine N(alpha)-methyltransferase [Archangium sp.]MDP3569844.1 L-histidine N(alpha)-methyltransferase [Archangium sp.]